MQIPSTPFFQEDLSLLIVFVLLAAIINILAAKFRFFKMPSGSCCFAYVTLCDASLCIIAYFGISSILSPFLFQLYSSLLKPIIADKPHMQVALLQLQNVVLILGFLTLYSRLNLVFDPIWKDPKLKGKTSYFADVMQGCLTCLIALSTVLAIDQLCEMINYYIFHQIETDQLAVQYLKDSLSSPFSFIVAIASISLAAPIIEECIFRGCVQNFIKRYLGRACAIILTSIVFSIMHFSWDQKASNFPIIVSLFTFSLYLGFIYEKTRSLVSNITLHALFNTISVIRILLDGQ